MSPLRPRAFLLAGVLAAFAAGCGGGGTDPPPFDPDDPRLENARLEFVSDQSVFLRHNQSSDLRVRYVYEDGSPIAGATIGYAIQGTGGGAVLSAVAADSDNAGIAAVHVMSGSADATFGVRVTPPRGEPIEFAVSVSETEIGSIVVAMSYGGTQPFTTFRPYLWTRHRCSTLDPERLPFPADRSGTPVNRVIDRPRFDNLAPRADYTVVIVAETGGEVAGWGCSDGVAVSASAETRVNIAIEDIIHPLVWAGVYDIESYLDFAGALPPSVEGAVRVFDELTDDVETEADGLCGSLGARGYGTDPGAFILDFAMRQTCAWECRTGEDYRTCSQLNHPLGDIRLFCENNFQTWSGAQPRYWSGCGAWEFAAGPAMVFINDQITAIFPDIVLNFLNMAGDLARAINRAHIFSVLTVAPSGELGAPFTHVLTEMQVRLRDWNGTVHEWRFDLADAGLSSLTAAETGLLDETSMTLTLPAHRFELSYGRLVLYVYRIGLLPLLGFSTTAELLGSLVNCDGVADWLEANVGILSRDTYRDACVMGLVAAGDAIETQIERLIGGEGHLSLAGTALATDVDRDRLVQTLANGVWEGAWGEGTAAGRVTGSFNGRRINPPR